MGAGVRTSVITVAESLIKAYGVNVPVRVSGNFRLGDIRDNYADLTKVKTLLDYSPKVDFATGIGHFAAWVDSQNVVADQYEKSILEMKAKGLYK